MAASPLLAIFTRASKVPSALPIPAKPLSVVPPSALAANPVDAAVMAQHVRMAWTHRLLTHIPPTHLDSYNIQACANRHSELTGKADQSVQASNSTVPFSTEGKAG